MHLAAKGLWFAIEVLRWVAPGPRVLGLWAGASVGAREALNWRRASLGVTAEARKTHGGLADRGGDCFGKAVHELSE